MLYLRCNAHQGTADRLTFTKCNKDVRVCTPVQATPLQRVTQWITLTLTGTPWQLKLLITIISREMKNTWGLHPHTHTHTHTHTHVSHSSSWRSDLGAILFFCFVFWHLCLYRDSFTAKEGLHDTKSSHGEDSNQLNGKRLSLLIIEKDIEISLGALIYQSLTNLIIVYCAIILVTVYYCAPSVITLAFVYISLKACVNPCIHISTYPHIHTHTHTHTHTQTHTRTHIH